mmetsp:Transcript_93432/g.264230  ORF Transcript_93432/g.264230 Transcript_93432/m.264230 type:complete len:206 (-) Transcript_93432:373-990(-)
MRLGGSARAKPCSSFTSGMTARLASNPHVQIFASPSASRCVFTRARAAWICLHAWSWSLIRPSSTTGALHTPASSGRGCESSSPSTASGQRVSSQTPASSSYHHEDGCREGSGARVGRHTSSPIPSAFSCSALPSAASRSPVKMAPTDCNGSRVPEVERPTRGGKASRPSKEATSITAALKCAFPSKGLPSFSNSPTGTRKLVPD